MILAFTGKARNDLRQIVVSIAKENPERAISFVGELEQRCAALKIAPLAYAVLPRYSKTGIRRVVHGNYLIFYHVRESQITVLRVLHSAMDVDAHLMPR
ncbi:MAG: type II toxin-antitoxin system RelE/ParE family toxin [Beijerinckiaceae bacterium]